MKTLNPTALKDMFDKMTEIDSDPHSKRAQEYYQKLEELERKNPNKKKGQIIIKTMKKGRTVKTERYQDGQQIGQRLTQQEQEFQKKYFDYKEYQFPEANPIELTVKQSNKQIKLANYRYPALTKDRKGVVYFINGYGDYCARYAYFAQAFAENGFDFICMDPRGYGHSEGKRAYIESEETFTEDLLKFFDLADQKFGGGKEVPRLGLGVSLGGLATVKMSVIKGADYYKGMGLVVPYFGLLNQKDIDHHMTKLRWIDKVYPSMGFPIPPAQKKAMTQTKFHQTIMADPLVEANQIRVRNLIVNDRMMRRFHEKEADQVTTPYIMILGGRDQVVDNKASKNFFEAQTSKIQDKDVVTYDDADHFMLLDKEYKDLVTKDLVGWFGIHI